MNWQDLETWEEAARQVAQLIEKNEFLEKRKNFYKEQLTERSAQLIEAIRMLQEEGINFDEAMMDEKRNRFNVETDLRINAELEQEAKAKAHASGDLAELLNDELNQKENDDER